MIGYVLARLLVMDFGVGSLILITLFVLAKYPIVGLHRWLPKLHVEASLFGSMVLAGVVLKFALVPSYWLLRYEPLVYLMLSGCLLLLAVDGKWMMAISSVVHISWSVLLIMTLPLVI